MVAAAVHGCGEAAQAASGRWQGHTASLSAHLHSSACFTSPVSSWAVMLASGQCQSPSCSTPHLSVPLPPGCHSHITSMQDLLPSSPHFTGSPDQAAMRTFGLRLTQEIPQWTVQLTSRRCRGPYCGGDTLSSQSSGATRGKDVSPLPLMPASAKGLLPAGNWAGSPCRIWAGPHEPATQCPGRQARQGASSSVGGACCL